MLLFYSIVAKVYKSLHEEVTRFAVFVRNLIIIEKHNARFAAGETSFEMGIGQFSDMVYVSITLLFLSLKPLLSCL